MSQVTSPPVQHPPRLSRRKKLLFALVTLLLVAVLLEVGLRSAVGWNGQWLDCHRGHPVLGWCLREGWSGEQSWTGGRSSINAQGLRDDRPVGPKEPGEKRLLVLGDSVTFGAEVRTDEAYPAQMEEALHRAGRPWRVLNAGVTSYDAGQEADWLEEFGWQLEPDVVAIAFCRNDVYPSDRSNGKLRTATSAPVSWLTEHSVVAFYLERGVWFGQARLASRFGRQDAPPSFEAVEEPYRRLAARARERRVPVVLIVFPTLDLIEGRETDDYSERLQRLAKELGWGVIDLDAAFRDDVASLFLPNDPVHPSAAGYRRAGQALAREVVERNLLP
jgi:lysophospholipase L1-like esterase